VRKKEIVLELTGRPHGYLEKTDQFTLTGSSSIWEIEYATDIVFQRRDDLHDLYQSLIRTVVHSAKAEHISTFLGRKLTGNYQGEIGNDLNTRIHGTRIRHQMGLAIIKICTTSSAASWRIETTSNSVLFFQAPP
jgi:hypothetical protein